jgi:hypothetical protein
MRHCVKKFDPPSRPRIGAISVVGLGFVANAIRGLNEAAGAAAGDAPASFNPSVMSTAVLASRPATPSRQTAIGVWSPSAWCRRFSVIITQRPGDAFRCSRDGALARRLPACERRQLELFALTSVRGARTPEWRLLPAETRDEPRRCAPKMRGLAQRLQRGATSQRDRQQGAGRADRPVSGTRPSLTGPRPWKRASRPVRGWGAVQEEAVSN